MNPPAGSSLHENATASSLGLARVLVFGIWLWQLASDPLQRLDELPRSAFDAPGILRVIPDAFWHRLLDAPVLIALKAGLLIGLVIVLLGVIRSKVLLGAVVSGLVVYQGLVRGFSGHINHAELALLYISALFVFFPVFDGLTVRTLRGERREGGDPDRAPYRTALLTACMILGVTYFFVGAVRLWKGIDLFSTPALRDYISSHALRDGVFDGTAIDPHGVPASVLGLPLWLFQWGFVGANILELSAPLALFSRALRLPIVLGLFAFHALTWALMDVPFPENMCLLALFSGTWLHRIAARLDRFEPEPNLVTAPS